MYCRHALRHNLLGLAILLMVVGSCLATPDEHQYLHFELLEEEWSEWSTWSECSRTCGGGSSYSIRHCLRQNCEHAEDQRIRYRTCENQDCPAGSINFRALQCSAYDDTPYQGVHYRWLPELDPYHHPCALYCRANNTDLVILMSPKVLDGTRCRDGSRDMCVNGTCRAVGCDRRFDSDKRVDVCGKCGGDGNSCRLVTGLYRAKPRKHFGMEDVITVPRNSRHISVSERGSGHVGLKLNDSSDADFLMPIKNSSQPKGVMRTSGIFLQYGSLSYGKEYFDVPGPVPDELKVVAVYDDEVWKYIRYEFYRPLEVFWKHDDKTITCTATCGGGLQFLWPICVDIVTGVKRDEQDCHDEGIVPPAPKVHRCNVEKCPTKWLTDPWTDCSKSCAGGYQTRTISCAEDTITGSTLITVNDSPCRAAGLPLPESRQQCNDFPCPAWAALSWSKCSVTCGHGWQYRVVQCRSHEGKAAYNCGLKEKPTVRKPCLLQTPCFARRLSSDIPRLITEPPRREPLAAMVQRVNAISVTPSWVSDLWGPCSVSCGAGVTSRVVTCKVFLKFSRKIQDLADSACGETKPEAQKSCTLGPCDELGLDNFDDYEPYDYDEADYTSNHDVSETSVSSDSSRIGNHIVEDSQVSDDALLYRWIYDEGGNCSPACGNGTKISRQICTHIKSGSLVAPDRCDVTARREDLTIPCNNGPCNATRPDGNNTRWEISAYGDCDVTCGRGVQSRTVVCRKKPEGLDVRQSPQQPGIIMPDIMCPAPKPQTRRNCSQVACPPTWQPSPWSKCSHTCDRGTEQRKLRCMQKLGTGEIVHVSPDYCSRKTPITTRQCSLKMCRPAKYGVQKWSQCDKTCGKAFSTRVIACLRVMDGSLKPQVVPTHNCRHLRPPATRKPCKHRKCPPAISTTDEVFIQTKNEAKVRLQVGASAYVFPRTTVIVRCRVERFKKGRIFWLYNERRIESGNNRRSKLVDGSLRVIRAEPGDSGTYSCLAGSARADIRLTVTENTTRDAHELEPPQLYKTPKLPAGFPEYDDVDLPFPLEPYPERRNQVFVSPVMSYRSPVRHHPNEISFVGERPVLMVNVRTSLEPDSTGFSQNPVELYPADVDTLLPADEVDYLTEVTADGDDPQMVINQLHELVQVSPHYDPSAFDGDFSDFDDLTEVNEQHELLPLENSPLLVNLQQEELDVGHRAPSIIRQPTVPPFQLGEIVNVDVGGSLIVGGAERITFLCEAEGSPEPVITWYRDETLLPDNSRQYILDDGSLRLFKPVFADAGVYKCVASNSYGNDTLTTTLSVTQKPHILSTTDSYQDFESEAVEVTIGSSIRCRLGSKVKIRCPTEAYPDPYVVWRKDSGGLRGNAKILSDNSIEINPTTPADQGLFSCEASNPSGSDYQASSLVLIDPPRISDNLNVAPDIDGMNGLPELLLTAESAEDHRVKANSSVMMGCPITGFPEPYIAWTFNGMPLTDLGNQLDYQLMQNDKILQIPNAGRETEGTYACHATNEGGNLTTSLRLGLIVYTYAYGELTECSATCGGSGTRHKQLRCLEDGGREVDEWYCIGVKKPIPALQPCNRVDCPPRFIASPWSFCSVSCGNGTRSRETPCMVLMSDGSLREVAAEECSADTRPAAAETCYDGKCPRWRAGPWKCTRRCLNRGMALKVRKIFCVSGDGTKLERRKACKGQPRPQRKSVCKSARCQPVWIASPWSVCSKSCGQHGFRTRILNCVYRGRRRQVAGTQCSNLQRPPVTLPCNRVDCRLGPRTPPVKLPEPCEDLWQSCVKIRRYRLCGMYRQNCCKTCRS